MKNCYLNEKKVSPGIACLLLLFFCGCAQTHGLTEEQQIEAVEKYPWSYWNINPSDDGFTTTLKVSCRILACPLTFGMSELTLQSDREETYRKYALNLYYSSFLGKSPSDVIQAFGAPTRVTTDGKDGKIYVWERVYTTGGYTYSSGNYIHSVPLQMHTDVKEFYFTSDDQCYQWRTEKK